MDLRQVFQKIRQQEAAIEQPHVVVVSHETPDGGKPGVKTEVPREVAARVIVEGRARLANEEESAEYHAAAAALRQASEDAALSARLQVAVVSDTELRSLKGSLRSGKK